MKKPSFLNVAALFLSTALLSACAHALKTSEEEPLFFSFMGSTMPCKNSRNDEISIYSCRNHKIEASFFDTADDNREGFALFSSPHQAGDWVLNAVDHPYKTEKEMYACPDEKSYVTTIKIFGKGKKSTQVIEEILVHNTISAMMFINYYPKKDDFSILTPEAINNLCTREKWLLPKEMWDRMKYADETEEENSSNDL